MMENYKPSQTDESDICWRAIPIQYDNYSQEKTDHYNGDVFGALSGFESPHFLWRRFQGNMCKAMIISKLKSYSLKDHEADPFVYEIEGHQNVSFSVELVSRHQSLLLIVSAFEAYLKDSFREVLKLLPHKYEGSSIEKVVKKYNFQNVESVNKAFSWLIDKDVKFIDECLNLGLSKRHRIIHESYYDNSFTEKELDQYYISFLIQAESIHDYLEDGGFYARIPCG